MTERKAGAWSYSGIKTYEVCPLKYCAEKVTKVVQFEDNESTLYGKELHKACEDYVGGKSPLDPRFSWMQGLLDNIKALPGDKYCELKMGIKKVDGQFEACEFFDKSVFMRGIADVCIVNDTLGHCFDYKTSKSSRYSDTRQLALMAAAMFLKFPKLEKIKAALLFVVAGDSVKVVYNRDQAFDIFADLHELLTQRDFSYTNDVWNARPNGLCARYCGYLECEHNGKR